MELYKNLKDYLKKNGVNSDTPPEEVTRLKAAYRSAYVAQFGREKRTKRITINPSKKDYQELETRAKEHDVKLARYVLDAALAYGSSGYIMPDREGLDALIYELNAIGRNINAVVKKMHTNRSYGDVVPYSSFAQSSVKWIKRLSDI